MKLIEPANKNVKKGSLQNISDQIRQLFQFGNTDEHTEDAIMARFVKGLDNSFVMLRNLQLESVGPPFPPILIGPAGLFVLNINYEKGFFKAKEDSWLRMDKASHQFSTARPNLIKQSQDYAKKLATILDVHGKSHPDISPLLIFANPGANIETVKPAIRIVMMDGVDSLIATLLKSDEMLHPNEINYLSDSLEVMANPEKAIPMGEGEDFFGRDLFVPEKKAPPKMPAINLPSEMPLPAVEEKLKFTKKQWAILIVLLVLTIVTLLGAILFAMSGR
jgi:hypothetical protein